MSASLIGVIVFWKWLGTMIERNLSYLVSLSAGVFAVIAYNLCFETFEATTSVRDTFIWIILGAVIIWILFELMPDFHHHHDQAEGKHVHNAIDARKILASDAVHNIGDGILLATTVTVNPILGAYTAFSIFLHEIVQEMSEFFVLRQADYSVIKALAWSFLVSTTILIGSIGGYWLISSIKIIEGPLLGISAGSFIVVILNDLIPHSVRYSLESKSYHKHILWFLIGIVVMVVVGILTPHS
jgi:zinc and cadmium transporter